MEELLEQLIDFDLMDFKCFDLLKDKLTTDEEFRDIVIEGINQGKIKKFPRELFDKVCDQNMNAPFKPIQIFIDGANLGACTTMSKIVSYSLPTCEICGGTLSILEGTKNSPDGRHTWISYQGHIIDTSLMLDISESYMNNLGYNEENRINPNLSPIYGASKDFANDKSCRKK